MALPILDHHLELARSVDLFLTKREALKEARASLEDGHRLPSYWEEFVAMGWLGLHIPEDLGGSGFGVFETTVVCEQLGRHCAGGPFLPIAVLASAIAKYGTASQRGAYVPALIGGAVIPALSIAAPTEATLSRINGRVTAVAGADQVHLMAIPSELDLILVSPSDPGVRVELRRNLDPSRGCLEVTFTNVVAPSERVIPGAAPYVRSLMQLLTSAEAVGGISACRVAAVEYAKERQAFGRPIGQFQAIKHHCAAMLVEERLAEAACWQAAGDVERARAQAAAIFAVGAYARTAKLNIQVHGGIGFTWQHDAHLFLRRAAALSVIAGVHDALEMEMASSAPWGDQRTVPLTPEEPPSEDPVELVEVSESAQAFAEHYRNLDPTERLDALITSGYMYPHWPPPWGKGATPRESAVIDDALSGLDRYEHLGPTEWSVPIDVPTIIVHGTDEQRARWILPSLRGELRWCQLFSEPGAGSDLAALSTRAERADGGWRLTGQKVWTSNAHDADKGLALVRTDRSAPKHRGISCMVVDMRAPGVTIRPLRQATGASDFNEVFLDEVFVADEDVVGDINGGWSVARTALDFERASLGGLQAGDSEPVVLTAMTAELRPAAGQLWDVLIRAGHDSTVMAGRVADLGRLFAQDFAIRALNARISAQVAHGTDVGIDGNITKFATGQHVQRAADLAFEAIGTDGAFVDKRASAVTLMYLQSRMTTIAGGTSEILLNVIAERALGLPRDP